MTPEQLMKLRNSNEAPFDHEQYTIWLHNKIIEAIEYELWEFREKKAINIHSGYGTCNHIFKFQSLQKVTA